MRILYQYLADGKMPVKPTMYTKLEAIFAMNAKYYLEEQEHLQVFR